LVAGSDTNGDGGAATDAVFVGVAGLALDPAGNLFVSDSGANRVRRIDAQTGIITTVAGTGRLDGPSGSAEAARQIRTPGPLAMDPQGRFLYVAEVVGRRVKRIDVIAGTTEDLGMPKEGWVSLAGLLWTQDGLLVSDAGLGQIFRLGREGIWTRIPSPKLKLRRGIRTMVQDFKGRVYVAEYFAHRVLQLNLRTGSVAVFAGTGEAGLGKDGALATESPIRGPDGLALDPEGKLLVADSGNRRICRIDIETGKLSTLHRSEPQENLELWTPGSLVVDGKGNLWMADSERDRILRFAPGAVRPQVFGEGDIGDGRPAVEARLAHPNSVVADRQGNIYISDTLHHRVRVVDARDGRIHTVAGTGIPGYNGDGIPASRAWLSYPAQIQVDDGGKLYIGDYYNNRVRVVDLPRGRIFTLAGTGQAGEEGDGGPANTATLSNPHVLFLDGQDSLIVTSAVTSSIRRIDLKTGTIESIPSDGIPHNRIIHGVDRWDGGLLLVLPRPFPGSIELLKNGKRAVLFGTPDISYPYHVAVSPTGELYICDTGRNRILRWNGKELSVVIDGIGRPRAISFDPQGNLLIAETFHNRVLRVRLTPKPGAK
jgi:DNA-binding beta-propeller fold protein YncE